MQYETTEQNFFLSIIEEIQCFQNQKSSLVQKMQIFRKKCSNCEELPWEFPLNLMTSLMT